MHSEDGKVRRPRRGGVAIGCAIVRGDRTQSQTSWPYLGVLLSLAFSGWSCPTIWEKNVGWVAFGPVREEQIGRGISPESFTSQLGGEGQRLLLARMGRKSMFVYNQQGWTVKLPPHSISSLYFYTFFFSLCFVTDTRYKVNVGLWYKLNFEICF